VALYRRAASLKGWRRTARLLFFSPLLLGIAWSQTPFNVPPLRSVVPLLCTESQTAHTRVRGTGVIADSSGTLMTAAHVVQGAHSDCTLSVMIPDGEWNGFRQLHAFMITECHLFLPLDFATCRLRPADGSRDWGYIRPAPVRARPATVGEPVSITSFAGWGLSPLVREGHIQGRQVYRRKDGCYCDFAIDVAAVEGMSGSPIISAQGEVIGILTLAGTGKFRGLSFGASLDEAATFLRSQGVPLANDPGEKTMATPGSR
jgi:hypothetical protein